MKNQYCLMIRNFFKNIIFWRELFYFLSALLLSFIILEIISPNIILAYFNINYLLLFYLIIALILLIISDN
jgi:hypothetical protein